jgi:hypothetical protein
MNPSSTLIGPTTDPTQTPILTNLPPFSGPLDPNAPPFDAAWWASQPPAVAAMQNLGDNSDDDPQTIANQRRDLAIELSQTYLVDWDIVGLGQGPYATAQGQRIPNGYTWVPSTGQPPIAVAPGLHVPGLPDYNPDPPYPPNSIVASNNAAYYLPYQAPAATS